MYIIYVEKFYLPCKSSESSLVGILDALVGVTVVDKHLVLVHIENS